MERGTRADSQMLGVVMNSAAVTVIQEFTILEAEFCGQLEHVQASSMRFPERHVHDAKVKRPFPQCTKYDHAVITVLTIVNRQRCSTMITI